MAKEIAPSTPVPMGDPKKSIIAQEGFCATMIDTKRTFQSPNEVSSKIMSELMDKK